jgi:hypothetical protein
MINVSVRRVILFFSRFCEEIHPARAVTFDRRASPEARRRAGGIRRGERELEALAPLRLHRFRPFGSSNAGCHHHAGAGDRSFSGTARHCANSRAARSKFNFDTGCIEAPNLLKLDA